MTRIRLETPLQTDEGEEGEVGQGFRAPGPPGIEVVEEGVPAVQGVEDPEVGLQFHRPPRHRRGPAPEDLHLQPKKPFVGAHRQLRG